MLSNHATPLTVFDVACGFGDVFTNDCKLKKSVRQSLNRSLHDLVCDGYVEQWGIHDYYSETIRAGDRVFYKNTYRITNAGISMLPNDCNDHRFEGHDINNLTRVPTTDDEKKEIMRQQTENIALQRRMAKNMRVSMRYVYYLKEIKRQSPELYERLERGEINISEARRQLSQ